MIQSSGKKELSFHGEREKVGIFTGKKKSNGRKKAEPRERVRTNKKEWKKKGG